MVCLSLFALSLWAQEENRHIQDGNQAYTEGDYDQAEAAYREALADNPDAEAGQYNLGTALYAQEQWAESLELFEAVAAHTPDPKMRARAYHNLGNAYLQQEDYAQGIQAYKNALKADPADLDTKYNLAYALEKMRQEEPPPQDQQQDQQDEQEQQQDEQQDQQDPPDEQQDQQQDQRTKNDYSPEELQRIFEALNRDDKEAQQKIQEQKVPAGTYPTDKDW